MASTFVKPTIEFSNCPSNWDVVVIGAGPAGSIAAFGLAKAGLTVLLVEKAEHPRFKVCGSCLSIEGMQLLAQMGAAHKLDLLHPIPIRGIKMHSGGRSVSLRLPGGSIISRSALDAALVENAIEHGAQYLSKTCATVMDYEGDWRCAELLNDGAKKRVFAKCVVAADGLSGRSLERVESMAARIGPNSRIGLGAIADPVHFERKSFQPGTIYMFCGAHGYLGAVLLEDGRMDLAAAIDKQFLQRLGNPGLAAKMLVEQSDPGALQNMQFLEHLCWQGTETLTRKRESLAAPRLLAIGDAANYAEPFTGEGMTWAIASAKLATSLILEALSPEEKENFAWSRWNKDHGVLLGNRQQTSILMAHLLRRTFLVRAAIRILAVAPFLAQPIVTKIHSPSTAS